MKNSTFFYLLFACIAIVSCNKNQNKNGNADQAIEDKTVNIQCYVALYEKDTINLKVNTLESGKISGTMDMKLLDMPIKTGKLSGEFKGDTLFADYSFIQGTNDKVVFKNPMAFLKKGNELILGNGKIVTYLGASYFAKGEPIDFENVKYKFQTVECIEK
jgi:hypothetical protein